MKQSADMLAAIDELTKRGAQNIEVKQGGKHPRVYFENNGKRRFVVVSSTPGDARAALNIREHVRRALGVVRSKKVGARRVRKNRSDERVVECPRITPSRNPFIPLIARNPALVDRAWAQYFGGLLRQFGHTPANKAMR